MRRTRRGVEGPMRIVSKLGLTYDQMARRLDYAESRLRDEARRIRDGESEYARYDRSAWMKRLETADQYERMADFITRPKDWQDEGGPV